MEENLGHKLRRARESAGLTVDDAVYRAKMPRAVVVALEADDFGFFASPLYARSFLKQYGDYVGLDTSPWVDDLVPTAMIDGEYADALIEIDEPSQPVIRERQVRSGSAGSLAALWLIVITGGLVWGGVELFNALESMHAKVPEEPIPQADPKPKPTTPEIADAEDVDGEKETVSTAEPEPPKRAIIVRDP